MAKKEIAIPLDGVTKKYVDSSFVFVPYTIVPQNDVDYDTVVIPNSSSVYHRVSDNAFECVQKVEYTTGMNEGAVISRDIVELDGNFVDKISHEKQISAPFIICNKPPFTYNDMTFENAGVYLYGVIDPDWTNAIIETITIYAKKLKDDLIPDVLPEVALSINPVEDMHPATKKYVDKDFDFKTHDTITIDGSKTYTTVELSEAAAELAGLSSTLAESYRYYKVSTDVYTGLTHVSADVALGYGHNIDEVTWYPYKVSDNITIVNKLGTEGHSATIFCNADSTTYLDMVFDTGVYVINNYPLQTNTNWVDSITPHTQTLKQELVPGVLPAVKLSVEPTDNMHPTTKEYVDKTHLDITKGETIVFDATKANAGEYPTVRLPQYPDGDVRYYRVSDQKFPNLLHADITGHIFGDIYTEYYAVERRSSDVITILGDGDDDGKGIMPMVVIINDSSATYEGINFYNQGVYFLNYYNTGDSSPASDTLFIQSITLYIEKIKEELLPDTLPSGTTCEIPSSLSDPSVVANKSYVDNATQWVNIPHKPFEFYQDEANMVTWDGSIRYGGDEQNEDGSYNELRTTAVDMYSNTYYHVSDTVYTPDQLKFGLCIHAAAGLGFEHSAAYPTYQTEDICIFNESADFGNLVNFSNVALYSMAIVYTENAKYHDATFPKIGIYICQSRAGDNGVFLQVTKMAPNIEKIYEEVLPYTMVFDEATGTLDITIK